jgi:hypothetical protein
MAGSSRSITQHPLFPALVTMWFGATFGLCSLVIGKPTLEAWVVAAGLPEVLSAARPPLGSTARVLLALAACGIGSLLGLALAAMLVRAKSPRDDAAPPKPVEPAEEVEQAESVIALPLAETEPADEIEPADQPETITAEPADISVPEPDGPEPDGDALAPYLRRDAGDADSHAPRAPFSVFDELGPDAGIASVEISEEGVSEDSAEDAVDLTGDHPLAEALASDDFDDDVAPDFAGSPPLPSNVHAIDAARLAQRGLPTRFADDSAPDIEPVAEAAATPAPAPDLEQDDLSTLSYVQLTERLAKAIAKNPQPPASLRRRAAPGATSTAVNSPGLERLRQVHARTAPANESATPDADEIRDALSDLRNIGGAA